MFTLKLEPPGVISSRFAQEGYSHVMPGSSQWRPRSSHDLHLEQCPWSWVTASPVCAERWLQKQLIEVPTLKRHGHTAGELLDAG